MTTSTDRPQTQVLVGWYHYTPHSKYQHRNVFDEQFVLLVPDVDWPSLCPSVEPRSDEPAGHRETLVILHAYSVFSA